MSRIHSNPTAQQIVTRIKSLQEKAKNCTNDLEAFTIQKELVDLLRDKLRDPQFMKELLKDGLII